jgi:hemoglobin
MDQKAHRVIGLAREVHGGKQLQKRYYEYIFSNHMYHSVTENSIADLVDTFYGKVRSDQLLGPIFAGAIGSDWGPHLDKMKAFWSSVLLASGTYKGNPMIAHLQLPRLTEGHFQHWLELWRETAATLCSEELAALFVGKAEMIGDRLLHVISAYHRSAALQSTPTAPQAM